MLQTKTLKLTFDLKNGAPKITFFSGLKLQPFVTMVLNPCNVANKNLKINP
jgi:hypothetical protein